MKSQIRFEDMGILQGELGGEASVPDLLGEQILQNDLQFKLDEADEIFEGYGRCQNAYPYRRFNCYSRELKQGIVKTAVLENDFLKAVFLPDYGGRLWSLWDKKKNRNLLYTNDVLRFSNLATRNAWFSGGVEWNIGIIGHTPLTTSALFTSYLEDDYGTPILRMYEYERIRQVTYQMDFWLGEKDCFLNARIRVVNFGERIVPMYWWSNIAVPEYEKGRLVVPAKKAYTFRNGAVFKTDIPIVEGRDITRYQNIPKSTDYFFEIPKEEPKYIINVDESGYGLFHLSTERLQSRKLFSWGHTQGGKHWQEFLTEKAGDYIEIQAGLGKTQYGCVPMAPHTAWEWLERYGAIELEKPDREDSFENLRDKVTTTIQKKKMWQEMETVLHATKEMAKKKSRLIYCGSGYGALKNKIREAEGKSSISQHLEFGECTEELMLWENFIKTGELGKVDVSLKPPAFMVDQFIYKKLREGIEDRYKNNWYAHYQLGIFYFQQEEYQWAEKEFSQSAAVEENAWAYHGIAVIHTIDGKKEEGIRAILKGMQMQKEDLSYQRDGFRMLQINEAFAEIIKAYEQLEPALKEDKRLIFYYIQALTRQGEYQKAYNLLCADGGLLVPDLREGELSLGALWRELYENLFGEKKEVPSVFDFIAFE